MSSSLDAMRCYAKFESSPVDNTLSNTSKKIEPVVECRQDALRLLQTDAEVRWVECLASKQRIE